MSPVLGLPPCALAIEAMAITLAEETGIVDVQDVACDPAEAGRQGGDARFAVLFKTRDKALKILAPRAGLEPATIRLTVECSTS